MGWKDTLIRWVHHWLSPLPRQHPGLKKILIVSTTGLGDTLWATPAIRALRKSHQEAYIAVLTTPLGEQVFQGNPHLNAIFSLRKPLIFCLIRLALLLRRKQFETVFIFHASQRILPLFCHFLGAGAVIGAEGQYKGPKEVLTSILPQQREHEIQRRLRMVGLPDEDYKMEVFFKQAEEKKAETLLPTGKPLIGIHPGAKDSFKRWPEDHFIALGNRLKKEIGAHIIVTGGPSEQEVILRVTAGIEGAFAIPSNLTIGQLAALLSNLSLFITNDTGPMHLASATQTPLIALFSPTDPFLCGPLKQQRSLPLVIQKDRACTPCLKKKCRDPFCLRQIGVEEVVEKAIEIVKFSL